MSEELLVGFDPIVDANARVLVLGSMPSTASLALGCYYGHRRNRFWPLMAAIYPTEAEKFLSDCFAQRYAALQHCGVGLWDTIGRCRRDGSLDSAIRDWVPNDIPRLLSDYPSIHTIVLNGRKSESVWKKTHERQVTATRADLRIVTVPSTSPANAAMSLDRLLPIWREAFCCS